MKEHIAVQNDIHKLALFCCARPKSGEWSIDHLDYFPPSLMHDHDQVIIYWTPPPPPSTDCMILEQPLISNFPHTLNCFLTRSSRISFV